MYGNNSISIFSYYIPGIFISRHDTYKENKIVMLDKYYTPTIEEFHVGFECETTGWIFHELPPQWHQCIVSKETIDKFTSWNPKYGAQFRVKYLDKADIEELGFVQKESLSLERDAAGNLIEVVRSGYFKDDWYLSYWNESFQHAIMIRQQIELSEYPEMRFLGTIKNKSELKGLLKQLGINA